MNEASITENRHRWYVVMSQVRAAGGDYDTAISLLDQAETLYRHGFYPDVRPIAARRHESRSPQAAAAPRARGLMINESASMINRTICASTRI